MLKWITEKLKKEYNTLKSILIYTCCIIFIYIVSKWLIEYPIKLAYKYNIKLDGEQYVNLYSQYKFIIIGVLAIAVLSIPCVKLINRLKRVSKDGLELYEENKQQDTYNNIDKKEVPNETVQSLINSDDEESYDEKSEEKIYISIVDNKNEELSLLKCENIKNRMKPLTVLVMRELYKNDKNNITQEKVIEYVKKIGRRNKKKLDCKNKEIAKNIIEFLKNNDIIEADDIDNDVYYFTQLGQKFMNYFINGII